MAIARLYHDEKLRADILAVLLKSGGSEADFDIVFNTTLLQFVKTVVKNSNLEIKGEVKGYIVGIAKFVWYKEANLMTRNRSQNIEQAPEIADAIEPEALILKQEKIHLLKEILSQLGQACKDVLMHWANGYPMIQIAKMVGYASEDMAKKKKYQCMKKLLLYMEQNPQIKEALR